MAGAVGQRIPNLTKLIFGHTHVPTAIAPAITPASYAALAGQTKSAPIPFGTVGDAIRAHNTGGWLQTAQERPEGRSIGASVFQFDSSRAERWWSVEM
jgi:hypothetical protein